MRRGVGGGRKGIALAMPNGRWGGFQQRHPREDFRGVDLDHTEGKKEFLAPEEPGEVLARVLVQASTPCAGNA